VAVEDQLVLAAHQPAEGDVGDVVARPLGEHPLALGALADVVGGGGDVDDQGGPGEGLVAGRGAGLPDVLADGQPDAVAAQVDDGPGGARLEVALLVEDAVVGEVHLAVDRVDGAFVEDGKGVVDVFGALGKAHHGDDPVGLGRELPQRRGGVREEVLLQQQVLGRVAGEGQLGEQHQVRRLTAGRPDPVADELRVARYVSDGGVDLAERQAHARRG